MGGREELRKAEAVPDDMKAAFIVLNGGGDLFTSESLIGGVRLREGDRDLVPGESADGVGKEGRGKVVEVPWSV